MPGIPILEVIDVFYYENFNFGNNDRIIQVLDEIIFSYYLIFFSNTIIKKN